MTPFSRIASAVTFLFLGATSPAWSVCAGDDLRQSLTEAEATALDAALKDKPYPIGNHWRATKEDKVVHLIGTMHLDDPRFDTIVPGLAPIVETADLLMLEMTDTEEEQLKTSLQSDPSLLILQDTSLPELMGDEDWALLSDAMRARSMPPFMAAKFQPWYVSMLLSIPTCMSLTDAESGGLDSRLESIADEAGVPKVALEPFETGFKAFASVSLDTQISMLRASLTAPDANEDLFATMLAAYFDEENAASWELSMVLAPRLSPLSETENEAIFSTMNQMLLVQRNRAWIPEILSALDGSQGHVVAAFGAAHLAGNDGVLALLEQEGFNLTRMPF